MSKIMTRNSENDLYGSTFSAESVKVVAESIGIGNLPDDAAKELADDISFRLKHIIQDAAKFMHHAKRIKLTANDVDNAVKIKGFEVRLKREQAYVLKRVHYSLNMVFTRRNHCLFDSRPAVAASYTSSKRRRSI